MGFHSLKVDAGKRNPLRYLMGIGVAAILLFGSSLAVSAEPLSLDDISYSSLPGEKLQIKLSLSGPAPEPGSFTIDQPASISIDLPNTKLNLKQRTVFVDTGFARTVRAVEAGGRTRVVVSLARMVPYQLRTEGNAIYVNLQDGAAAGAQRMEISAAGMLQAVLSRIENVDFRRGVKGEGRVSVTLSDPSISVDTVETKGRIEVFFVGAELPQELVRRLDVIDFATPVTTIDAFNEDGGVRMVVKATGDYEYLAYQTGDSYTLEVKPIAPEEKARLAKERVGYTGEKLSLNFQNIEVRAVLQLIADFTGLNIVASDSVQGNITLRLKNVPWDQALEIILKSKGLGMRKSGNVVLIAPNEEIAAREKMELEAEKQKEELAPLRTEFFQINYANAIEIAELLKSEQNTLLSERGSVTIDERTNTLMILDTEEKLAEIRTLVKRLDIPVKQVLIESRIVVATDDFTNELGARTGVTYVNDRGGNGLVTTTGAISGADTIVNSGIANLQSSSSPFPVTMPSVDDRLNVDLPVTDPAGQLSLAILGSDYLVDLELSAMQVEGKGELISNPRVITSNQHEAMIEQGVEIPYLTASSSGATTVSFKKAVLSLTVKPQITPDDRVLLNLRVTKDAKGEVVSGVPSINTREVSTEVLVDNGDTVVLGGIYEQERKDQENKVPFLGDIPILGMLFRSTIKEDNKAELLIFVTPRILKEGASLEIE